MSKPLTIYDYYPSWLEDKTTQEVINFTSYELSEGQKQYLVFKRVMDFIISLLALIVLFIPFIIISILLKISSPLEPVFFLQERVGLNGKIFKIIKFRSMKSYAPHEVATQDLEHPEEYLSRIGKVLRRYSIDELPQFFNVLVGDMSFIGPRPLIVSEHRAHYLRLMYGCYQVRPGIIGLAQVNGRDTLDDYKKVKYDYAYVKNLCIRGDLMIFLKSIGYVAKHEDIIEGKTNDKVPAFAKKVNENINQTLSLEIKDRKEPNK